MKEQGMFAQIACKAQGCGARLLLPAVLLAGGLTQPVLAQFSGPALTLPTQPPAVETPTPLADIPEPHPHDILLVPGDVLTIHLFGSTEFEPVVRVGLDGSVQLPLLGLVKLRGLTVEQAEDAIASRLKSAGMYKDPQITIQITEAPNQYATVTGELHALVPLVGVRRLLDVLAMASSGGGGETASTAGNVGFSGGGGSTGGFPLSASHVVTIIRQGQPQPIVVDLGTDPLKAGEANIVIQPRDLIVLSRVGSVYIIGAFAKQGAIPLDQNSPLTLMQATSLAGGVGFEGRYEDLRIIRTEGLERKEVKVDIKHILRGQAPDPILQANDIVFLPTNAIKAALKGNGLNLLTNVADVAVLAFIH
jgi:polysaccharide export outer membrane protein